jgi:DNA ligase-1
MFGYGCPMNATDLMHGKNWTPAFRVRGWIVQEKFNGIRALWTGKELMSREGNVLPAPAWFTAGLPDVALDCELILAAGKASPAAVSNIARSATGDWSKLRLAIFDAPQTTGGYVTRHVSIPEILSPSAFVAAFKVAWSLEDLRQELRDAHAKGVEGFMLRHPSAPYRKGRHSTLLKFKSRSLYSPKAD